MAFSNLPLVPPERYVPRSSTAVHTTEAGEDNVRGGVNPEDAQSDAANVRPEKALLAALLSHLPYSDPHQLSLSNRGNGQLTPGPSLQSQCKRPSSQAHR